MCLNRYGHLSVCAKIVGQLCEHTSSEHLHFWLLTLEELSEGESCLRDSCSLLDRLGAATSHYYKALAAVKVVIFFYHLFVVRLMFNINCIITQVVG